MGYDALGRLNSVNAGIYTRTYAYRDISTTQTTTQIASVSYSGLANNPTYGYTYDALGNISTYTAPDGEVITYTYDDQGQLLSAVGNRRYAYTYDNVGNILTANGHTYTYGSTIWRDLLTKFDGQTISYDNIGNPTSYYNGTRWAFTWNNGRQLVNASSGNDLEDVNISYVYDADGLRTSKTVTTNVYHVHEYTSEVCAPTCVTKGYTTYICSCGDSYQGTYVAALGHLYDSVSDKICNRCGYDRSGSVDVPVDPVRPNPPVESASITAAETGDGAIVSSTTESHSYIYASGKLMREVITTTVDGGTPTDKVLDFFYDESGRPFAVKIDNVLYYYITNLQGDVMQIVNSNGTAVASYEYDPYGNIISATGSLAETNPLRYRGYVYDTETGFYYLQSRYYDPSIGRFLNADSYASTGQGVLGNNMFAYCGNNPVNRADATGRLWGWIIGGILFVAACLNNENQMAYEASTGESDLTSTSYSDGSHEKLTRQEKMDYAKQQTGDDKYTTNAWRFQAEYTFHEIGWNLTGWAYNKNIPVVSNLAAKFVSAEVDPNEWDERWYVNVGTVIVGVLGL